MVWHKVAESRAELFGAGVDMAEVEVDGKTVLVVKVGEEMYACASKCPHAGARMKDGYLDAQGNLVCPLHRYRFDPKTGRNVSGEGYFETKQSLSRCRPEASALSLGYIGNKEAK